MPHSVRNLRWLVKHGLPVALMAAAACEQPGELRVLADSTTTSGAVEVLAVPATGSSAIAPDPARRAADSLAARFRRERAALNARAESLSRADRRTPAYAAAYAAYLTAAAAAGRLRDARDSARRALPPPRPLPDSLLAHAIRAPLSSGAATLSLRAGAWWIGALDARRTLVGSPSRVEITAGAADTLTIRE